MSISAHRTRNGEMLHTLGSSSSESVQHFHSQSPGILTQLGGRALFQARTLDGGALSADAGGNVAHFSTICQQCVQHLPAPRCRMRHGEIPEVNFWELGVGRRQWKVSTVLDKSIMAAPEGIQSVRDGRRALRPLN